jgi:hypothetical protein
MADDPMEAIALMRVTGALARRDARLPHPDYDKESIDTAEVCWGDLRALLAAYQSVREENARLKFAVDLVLDAAPKNVLHRTGGTE